jgi:hypothetical protein
MSVVKKVWAAGRRLYEETVDRLGLLLAQRDGITPPSNAVERQQDYVAATKAPFAHSDEEPLPPKAVESESPVGPAKSFDLVAAIVENPRFAAKFHPYAKDQRSFIVPCNPASDVPRDVRGVPVSPDHFLWGYTREGFLLWGEHDVQTMRKISEASGGSPLKVRSGSWTSDAARDG